MITDSKVQENHTYLNYVVGYGGQYVIVRIDDKHMIIKDGVPYLPIYIAHVSRDLTDFCKGIFLSMS